MQPGVLDRPCWTFTRSATQLAARALLVYPLLDAYILCYAHSIDVAGLWSSTAGRAFAIVTLLACVAAQLLLLALFYLVASRSPGLSRLRPLSTAAVAVALGGSPRLLFLAVPAFSYPTSSVLAIAALTGALSARCLAAAAHPR